MSDMDLHELAAFKGEAFVKNAYVQLVGRQADETGLHHYQAMLRRGLDPMVVLADLSASAEGRAHGASVVGLASAVRWHKLRQLPLIGAVVALLTAGMTRSMSRRFNRLDLALYELSIFQNQAGLVREAFVEAPGFTFHFVPDALPERTRSFLAALR